MNHPRIFSAISLVLGLFVLLISATGSPKLGPISILGAVVGLWVSVRAAVSLWGKPKVAPQPMSRSSITAAWFLTGTVIALFGSIALFVLVGGAISEKLVLLSGLVLIFIIPVAFAAGLFQLGKTIVKRSGDDDKKA